MGRLRPFLALLLCLAASPLLAASGPEVGDPPPPDPSIALQPDGGAVVHTRAYRALVGPDGNLHSFRVGDFEMLDDTVAISLGAFFYADGPRKLPTINVLSSTALEASDGTYTIQYRFRRREIRILLTNAGRAPVPFFVVLSPRIAIISNLETREAAAAPAAEPWPDVRLSAPDGAYLDLMGGTRVWGPWLGRQVWEVDRILPQQHHEIRLVAGIGDPPKATLEQLIGLRLGVVPPEALVGDGDPINLRVSVENRSEAPLSGTLAMELSASRDDHIIFASSPIEVPPRQIASTAFTSRVHAPDFYLARVTLSAEGRQLSTARAVVGYRAPEIIPNAHRPPDFDEFWSRLLSEAADRSPDYRLDLLDERASGPVAVWVARYAGLAGKTVHGWFLTPPGPGPHPAILYLSGFGARPIEPPVSLAGQGYVVLAIDTRGNPVDRARPRPFEDYSTVGIASPQTYVYREIAGHALRAVTFLAARPEVDPARIAALGVSDGGGIALILGALSPRVRAVAADAPMLGDFSLSLKAAAWPYVEIASYLRRQPQEADRVRAALSYFDLANFAPRIRCPVLLSTGFLDPVSLPAAVYGVFNTIPGPKEMRAFPQAGHEGGGRDLWAYKLQWLAATLRQGPDRTS